MKIRTSFVSNSSSSSFIALITKSAFETLQKQLNPLELATLNELGISTAKFLGQECVVFECSHGNYTFLDYVSVNDIVANASTIASERNEDIQDYLGERADWSINESERKIESKIRSLEKNGEAFTHEIDY